MGVAKTDTSQRIVKDAARQVTFSKRRAGLFKKAFELSVLCEVELAVVVFSQTGKVFSFAHPDIDHVISKYRGSQDDAEPYDDEKLREIHARVEELLPRYNRAVEQSKIVKEHHQRLRQLRRRLEVRWWEHQDVQGMSPQQLLQQREELQGFLDFLNSNQHHQTYQHVQQEVVRGDNLPHQLLTYHPHQPPPFLSTPPLPLEEQMIQLRDPTPPLWQLSSLRAVGDGLNLQLAATPGVPAATPWSSTACMQWQQQAMPSSSGDCSSYYHNPNLNLVASNAMRQAQVQLGPQNYVVSGAEPMSLSSSSRGIMPAQQFRAPDSRVGGDDGIQFHISESAAGTYHPQDHLQQQDQHHMIIANHAAPTSNFYPAPPDYMQLDSL